MLNRVLHRWAFVLPLIALAFALAAGESPLAGNHVATNLSRLEQLGLPRTDGALTLYRSRGAEAEAAVYGAELAAALDWYRAQLGWSSPVTMAILDKADYGRVTGIPYPSPHAENRTGLIIMADHIDEHPGFTEWDLEPMGLNTSFVFHEIGHVIARDLGIWSRNSWVNELFANIFMAGYVRAERPQFDGFQSGLPRRFVDAGRYRNLANFDELYFSMGQLNYLWFQFQIAQTADFMVSGAEFPAVIDGLRREFPMQENRGRESVEQTFIRLERIRPGVTEIAADLNWSF